MVINLTGITAPTNINIVFHVPFYPPNSWNYRGQFLFLDHVVVEDIPACPPVYNVAINTNTIIDTSAEINWDAAGSETSWEISVQPYGTPAPVGNTLPQYLRTTNVHPYTITGLTPSTRYQIYVRAICSGTSQSTWSTPVELLTKCDLTNICQYTITLDNGTTGRVQQSINLMQNNQMVQALTFPNNTTPLDYQVYLCRGIEFSLYWQGSGNGLQYSDAQITIRDYLGNVVWTSPRGLGTINSTIYSGVSNCIAVTCPQPTNLAVSNLGVLSWTPGGSETQWEVFVQPLGLGSLPQSGVIVNTTSYTPQASDFLNPLAGTNEFFVRAVCSSSDKSYWSGPKVFIRNDEASTAIVLPVNTGGTCTNVGTKASFLGATVSPEVSSCGGLNGGDIWYEFVATSKVHTIELSNFGPGSYYNSSYTGAWPRTIITLYEVQSDGSLVQKACSENHSIVAEYASECVVGTRYKIRVAYNASTYNDKKFDICVSTPADLCERNAFNYSFEKLPMQSVTGISTIIDATVVPGWRVNTDFGTMFFQEEGNSPGVIPYEGGQCVQLTHDNSNTWNASDPNIEGLYKDFDTSEILKMKYSFASASRITSAAGTTVELWAGPPSGPFTQVTEHNSSTLIWSLVEGTYDVPVGQTTTRFIFRVKNYAIGHLLDAANFKSYTSIETQDFIISCNQEVNVQANGIGVWEADVNNPAVTIIADATNPTTTISGFNTPGVYTYYWKSRYCEEMMTVTYQGFNELATTTSPVEYCMSDTATTLTASAPSGNTLVWYTDAVGGTGNANAPTPSTATAGTTTYYVALVDSNGCAGPRTAIDVVVNDLITPIVDFSYDTTSYCTSGTNPVLTPASGFTTGGTYSATPVGLTIDSATGAINLATSLPGTYEITYDLPRVDCTLAGSSNYTIEVTQAVTFDVVSECESQVMFLNVNATGGSDLTAVDYTWQDANGNTIGSNAPTFNVNDYLALNSSVSLPTTISVTVTNGGCELTKSYSLVANECSLIPRGISPNGDGDNDAFDLTGLGAKQVSIFNRYGTEVYSYSGNYTNQWNGNDKDGSNLPDGTYFYNITFQDGKSVTGWVYIIRQY
jgi:gliding motility-associated-like protein